MKTRYIPLILDPVHSSSSSDESPGAKCEMRQCALNQSNIPKAYISTPYVRQTQPVYFNSFYIPTPGKVSFLPDGRSISPDSIIHFQKQQKGFFRHPILVVSVNEQYAHFYALTSCPPTAIGELGMCLRLGRTTEDEGPEVLRLAVDSLPMTGETWVNLEQMFRIESKHLREWSVDVTIAASEIDKIITKIHWLESQQNRFIYKPVYRSMSRMSVGSVVMLPNPQGASTLGAPILILENNYPQMVFLRIKLICDNHIFDEPLDNRDFAARRKCLAIRRHACYGHDGTPVMLVKEDSPNMRQPSYVELQKKPRFGRLDKCQTWCYPPVQIQPCSMKWLFSYMDYLFGQHNTYCAQPAHNWSSYHPYAYQDRVRGHYLECNGMMTPNGYGMLMPHTPYGQNNVHFTDTNNDLSVVTMGYCNAQNGFEQRSRASTSSTESGTGT